uniref:Rad21_Rec8_N domain-containing protein n=1 Tax=Rhabditophanes sp. KR3021 TaxID=114890 RepID=A0AC35TYC5_9BILA
MFFSQYMLAKKGPLSKVWLAAHWEKKLSKAQVYETNVEDVINEIMKPKVPMALRTTGHLLLGAVRIYSRKTKYLLADCNEAFLKIKMSFKSGEEETMLNEDGMPKPGALKIPDVLGDFDCAIPDFNEYEMKHPMKFSQTRADDITLKDESAALNQFAGDDFGSNDFGEGDFGTSLDNDDELTQIVRHREMSLSGHSALDTIMDGFDDREKSADTMGPSSSVFRDSFPLDFAENDVPMEVDIIREPGAEFEQENNQMETESIRSTSIMTLRDAFSLEPLSSITPIEKAPRSRKKRKLILDEHKTLSGEEMKANMANFATTIQPLDLAPPSKKLMRLLDYGTADKLFNHPLMPLMVDENIVHHYKSCCVPKSKEDFNDTASIATDLDLADDVDLTLLPHHELIQDDYVEDFEDRNAKSTTPLQALENFEPNNGIAEETKNEEVINTSKDLTSPENKKKRTRTTVTVQDEDDEEESKCSRRTHAILTSINNKLRHSEDEEINFTDLLTKSSSRKTAAQKFYALLELTKNLAIKVDQDEPYGNISICPGPQMNHILNN